MTAKHGTIGEFDNTQEDWESYVERVDLYLIVNDIADEGKKRATLLTLCGPKTYHVIRDLVAPKTPAEVEYNDIVSLVKQHYNPKPVVTVQRFKFNSRSRQKEETVATFVAELRHLAMHCQYGDSLNDMLRDRLICGIDNKRIQCRLLSEKDVDFKRALEVAQAMESADKDSQHLQSVAAPVTETTAGVNRLRTDKPQTKEGRSSNGLNGCYRCGGRHLARDCRFKEADCHACGKRGHISRACRSEKPPTQKKGDRPGKEKTAAAYNVVEEDGEDPEEVYTMFQLTQSRSDPLYLTVTVNQKQIQMEIDTGAAVSIISEETYQRIWEKDQAPRIQPAKLKLRTYTGEEVAVAGRLQVEVKHGSQQVKLPLVLVRGQGPSLLGRDWLVQLKLDWKAALGPLSEILEAHKTVFQEELGPSKELQPRYTWILRFLPNSVNQDARRWKTS